MNTSSTTCSRCGAIATPGSGLWLGAGWTTGWSSPFLLCYTCIESEHGVRIGQSRILPEEYGLFATRSFSADSFLVPYCGEEIPVKTLWERYQIDSAPCGAFLREGFSVDASDPYLHGLGRYANDVNPFSTDEENNAYMNNFTVGPPEDPDQVTWPGLYARIDIQAGDEITIAYGKDYWDVWAERLGITH